jgi:hypothetical protein
MNWVLRHGATFLIFGGGMLATLAAFVVDRRARGEREKRRIARWPMVILFGTIISGVGALWAGFGQDQLLDYLSGGDSYGFFMPGLATSKSIQFVFVAHGEAPLYDVIADASDVTKYRTLWVEKGLPPEALEPKSTWTDSSGKITTDQLLEIQREISTNISLGNIAPGTIRPAWEAPIPQMDDQRYAFSIWARNGLITEQLLMHRTASGMAWAWHVERTSAQVKNGKQSHETLVEYAQPGFPAEKIIWN